jgi:O-antigen/teichoic acid export membrane protein
VINLREIIFTRQGFIPPDPVQAQMGGQVISGSLWSGVSLLATTFLQFVRSMIFARLLMPADFGIISLANVFTYFILIFANFGFNSSVIYHRGLTKEDLSTCWWGNLAVDVTAALACIIFAFSTRRFVDSPQVTWVIMLLALQFVLVSVGSVNGALMRRAFMFRQIAVVKVVGSIVIFAGALFAVAVLRWGVYGLVTGMVAGSLTMTILQFYYLPWLPSRAFSRTNLKKHIRYGRWFLGLNLINYSNSNIDRIFIGTRLSSTQLGFYEYATSLPVRTCQDLAGIIGDVFFPAYSNLQDNHSELRRVILSLMRYSTLMVYPILIGLAVVAHDFVLVAYSEKWLPIVAPMRIFCLIGLMRAAYSGLFSLCYGLGKPHMPFKWSLIAVPLNAGLLYYAVVKFGVVGVAVAKAFLDLFLLSTLRTEIMRLIDLPLRKQLLSLGPALGGCLVMALPLLALQLTVLGRVDSAMLRLLLQVAAGALLYGTAVFFFWRTDFDYLLSLPKRLRRR